jgi:hypothetical protein
MWPFKKAWESSDREKRLKAAAQLNDQKILASMAISDSDWRVRRAAAERITDQTLLAEIAAASRYADTVMQAVEKLSDQVLLREAVGRITDYEALSVAYGKLGASQKAYQMLLLSDLTLACDFIASGDRKREYHYSGCSRLPDYINAVENAWRKLSDPHILYDLYTAVSAGDYKIKDRAQLEILKKIRLIAGDDLPPELIEIKNRALTSVLAHHVFPYIEFLKALCVSDDELFSCLAPVFHENEHKEILLDVIGSFRSHRFDWRKRYTENTDASLRDIFAVPETPEQLVDMIHFKYECNGIEWHRFATQRTVELLAAHMKKYGPHRGYFGFAAPAENYLKQIYEKGFLRGEISRYYGTLLFKAGEIEVGSGDDTYRDIWEDGYFFV